MSHGQQTLLRGEKKNRDIQLFLPGSQLWVMEFQGSLWEFSDFWGRVRS